MTVAQIQPNPTNLDLIDKINEIIRNLLYVDDSTIKICGGGGDFLPLRKFLNTISYEKDYFDCLVHGCDSLYWMH